MRKAVTFSSSTKNPSTSFPSLGDEVDDNHHNYHHYSSNLVQPSDTPISTTTTVVPIAPPILLDSPNKRPSKTIKVNRMKSMKSNSRLHLQPDLLQLPVSPVLSSQDSPTLLPNTYSMYCWQGIVMAIQQFKSDAIYLLYALIALCLCWLALTWSILHEALPSPHETNALTPFYHAVYSTLLIGVPLLGEHVLEVVCFVVEKDNKDDRFRRWTSRGILAVVLLPHVSIYCHMIPGELIDLLLFDEFVVLLGVLLYRLCSLTTSPSCEALKAIYLWLTTSAFFAFLYNLHNEIALVWQVLFALTLGIAMVLIVWKVWTWYRYLCKMTTASKQLDAKLEVFFAYALLVGLFLMIALVYFVSCAVGHDLLFFSIYQDDSHTTLVLVYLLVMLTSAWLQSYELRKSEHKTKITLTYNRKMTRSISHEIRTPLNTAFMGLDLLISNIKDLGLMDDSKTDKEGAGSSNKRRKGPAASTPLLMEGSKSDNLAIQKKDLLETAFIVKEGCDISLGILNQLLTFEKLSAGMMQLEPKLVSLLDVLEHNAILFRMQAQQTGIRFVVDLSMEEKLLYRDIALYVDEHKINQVIRNLLSNAMKFTPKNGTVIVKVYWHNPVRSNSNLFERSNNMYSTKLHDIAAKRGGGNWLKGANCTSLPEHGDIELGLGSRGESSQQSGAVGKTHVDRMKQKYLLSHDDSPRSNSTSSWLPSINSFGLSPRRDGGKDSSARGGNKSISSYSASLKQKHEDLEKELSLKDPTKRKRMSSKTSQFRDIIHDLVHQTISGTKPAGSMVISIIDSGPGVSAEDQTKLFQEYVQISPGELQKGQGTGLGLSISKAIVQLHGGNIAMTSEGRGKGSTFYIELPSYRLQTGTPDGAHGIRSYRSNDSGGSNNSKSLVTSLRRRMNHVSDRISGRISGRVSGRDSAKNLLANHMSPIRQNAASMKKMSSATTKVVPCSASLEGSDDQGTKDNTGKTSARSIEANKDEDNMVRMVSFQSCTSDGNDGNHQEEEGDDSTLPVLSSFDSQRMMLQSVSDNNLLEEGTTDPVETPSAKVQRPPTIRECEEAADALTTNFSSRSSDLSACGKLASTSSSFLQLPNLLHILLVDDSVPNRKMLSRLLTRDGHLVTELSDGKEAIEFMQQQAIHDACFSPTSRQASMDSFHQMMQSSPKRDHIDVILIDYFMNQVNGPEAVKHIRKLGFQGPIIGVTGLMDEDSNEFIEHGADIVLCKPVNLTAIWKALRSIRFM